MKSSQKKYVYLFSADFTEGRADMRDLLGGKGANLAEMSSLGLPVPPGFTISTEACTLFYQKGQQLSEEVKDQVKQALAHVEEVMGRRLGDKENPLLVSVRSGARVSMPGMMDTVLNLGLNETTLQGLEKKSPRFAWDSYRRFLQMYSNVVMGVNGSLLEVKLEDYKHDKGYTEDTQLTVEDLQTLVKEFKQLIVSFAGRPVPEDPYDQLWEAIEAVFRSWNTPRAKTYREINHIPEEWGTAVNVQTMVFGNLSESSGTGVAFSRDPSTGERKFFGEYLMNAQGEDVVAGIRTPLPLRKADGPESLEASLPDVYKELEHIYQKLEKHYRDMQDMEFTIEDGRLWMLQTRNGKRTARAALRMACDMVDEGLITPDEALLRVDAESLNQLLHPSLDPQAPKVLLTKGLPASPGGASGQIVFSSEDVVRKAAQGIPVILVRTETSPEDIEGMVHAEGILTSRGGMTSHAAVVARGMGKCCVAGCEDAVVSYDNKTLKVGDRVLQEGDVITLDGSTGEVFLGKVPKVDPVLDKYFERFMGWADEKRALKVFCNADTPKDAHVARHFGAQGIGLCRTEHMFFSKDRIDVMRSMIFADTAEKRKGALEKLLPMQREDFLGLFKEMDGLPVTIRLLDPPLHEFLPHTQKETEELAQKLELPLSLLQARIQSLREANPMLGHRGCRLALTYPEIYQMQAKAIAEAACEASQAGVQIFPEIMIPLVGFKAELEILKNLVEQEVKSVLKDRGLEMRVLVGTMIELPRAAITADKIAQVADFFSFGTNDLTQTTLGISRDDAARFIGSYVNEGIFSKDPFSSLDQEGVGALIRWAVQKGRQTNPQLKLGVCGEHGGDPMSIDFFHKIGLDYVSCSPYRVPVARLSAAQAAVRYQQEGIK